MVGNSGNLINKTEITCIYDIAGGPLLLTKQDVEAIRAFRKIVLNYIKIKRLDEAATPSSNRT